MDPKKPLGKQKEKYLEKYNKRVIELDPNDFLRWQKKVQGVYMGHANIKRDIPFYASLFLQGRLNLTDLISAEIGLDDIDEAYATPKTPSPRE